MYLSRGKERHYGVTIHHSETLSNGHIVCSVLYAICMRCSFLAQCKRQNHKSWRTNTTMLKMRKTITMWESMCKKRRCTQKSSGNKKIKEQLEIFEIFELRSIFLRFSFTTSVFIFSGVLLFVWSMVWSESNPECHYMDSSVHWLAIWMLLIHHEILF